MAKVEQVLFYLATTLTLLAVGLWIATGRDAYTKFEVVEQVERPVDAGDSLAGTGFYDNDTIEETVRRPAFRFGLLPTPAGVFDKHVFSVVSVGFLPWIALFVLRAIRKFRGARRSISRQGESRMFET